MSSRVLTAAAAIVLSACATSGEPRLVTVPQRGARPVSHLDQIGDYRTAAATIVTIMDRDLGFAPFPVTFRFYPGRASVERALLASGYDAALARTTARTMAAVGGHRTVLINEESLVALPWGERVALLAHEVGHSLQYEFGGGRRGASDQWLREGFAEWLSIRVLERLGEGSMAAARRDRLQIVRGAGKRNTPSLDTLVTFPQWVHAGQRQGQVPYALAFLGVDVLLQRHGPTAVVDYFKRFATSQDREGNFRAAFGEDLESFQRGLSERIWPR